METAITLIVSAPVVKIGVPVIAIGASVVMVCTLTKKACKKTNTISTSRVPKKTLDTYKKPRLSYKKSTYETLTKLNAAIESRSNKPTGSLLPVTKPVVYTDFNSYLDNWE